MKNKNTIDQVMKSLTLETICREVWKISVRDSEWYGRSRLTFAHRGSMYVILPPNQTNSAGIDGTSFQLNAKDKDTIFNQIKQRANQLVTSYHVTGKSHFLHESKEFAKILYEMSNQETSLDPLI